MPEPQPPADPTDSDQQEVADAAETSDATDPSRPPMASEDATDDAAQVIDPVGEPDAQVPDTQVAVEPDPAATSVQDGPVSSVPPAVPAGTRGPLLEPDEGDRFGRGGPARGRRHWRLHR